MANDLSQLLSSYRSGHVLDAEFYADPTVFRTDLSAVFNTMWLFAGHGCRISQPGEYFTYDLGDDSLIITRDETGVAHALHNTCRHRGSRICADESGSSKRLVCPYHQWTYAMDGRLETARGMPATFDKGAYGLEAAHLREVAGLIFVSLADAPPDFEPAAEELRALLGPHGFEAAKVAHTIDYEIEANWKLVIENHRECLHCPTAHKEYAKIHYDTRLGVEAWQPEIETRTRECREKWLAMGLSVDNVNPTSNFTGAWWRANRTAFPPGHVTESPDGQPVAPVMGEFSEADVGTARAGTYPNFWLHATSDHATTMRVTPVGPTRTRMRAEWLVRSDAVEGRDYEVDRVIAFTDRVNREDKELILGQAAGVRSSRYRPGPLADEETRVRHFLDWYVDKLGNAGEPADA